MIGVYWLVAAITRHFCKHLVDFWWFLSANPLAKSTQEGHPGASKRSLYLGRRGETQAIPGSIGISDKQRKPRAKNSSCECYSDIIHIFFEMVANNDLIVTTIIPMMIHEFQVGK